MKPEYRIKMEIYDDQVGEVVCFSDEPLMSNSDDNLQQMFRLHERFTKDKQEHEATHYENEMEKLEDAKNDLVV